MFKFELNQTVYYLENNRLFSAPILSRLYVDNLRGANTEQQIDVFNHFGQTRILYRTIHGTYDETKLFRSKEELALSIINGGD